MLNSNFFTQLKTRVGIFIRGGDWSLSLPETDRQNLNNYWFDGLFSAASDTIPINYLSLYLLVLGATSSQVGLFTSLTNLAAAFCLLPGALLVEKFGHRKNITVWFGGHLARYMLLGLALLPFGLTGQILIWGVIFLSIIRSAAGNIAFPAWVSISGDIVPLAGRGRFFGSRSFAMVTASIVITYLIGEFITRIGSIRGYQAAIALSFAAGMVSTYYFTCIKDPQANVHVNSGMSISFIDIIRDLRSSPVFLFFCAASALWNFSVNVAGPFFNVYMVQNLKFTAAMVGITAVATNVTKMLIQKKVGELSDKWGPGVVQMITMFLMPALPLSWLFITKLWHVVLLNLFGGVLWGTFELVSFNFLLQLTPDDLRARYSAIFQVVVTVALAAGAAVGSGIILTWGYNFIFIISAIGRIIASFFFFKLIRNISHPKEPKIFQPVS